MTPSSTGGREDLRSDLLDELTSLAGCEFLSDLPRPQWRQAVCRALEEIDPDCFTLQAWKNSVAYFLEDTLQYETPREARAALLAALNENP